MLWQKETERSPEMSFYRAAENDDPREVLSRRQVVTLWVLAVALLPPVYTYATEGLPSIFRYFAADAFVYLSVALCIARGLPVIAEFVRAQKHDILRRPGKKQ